MKTLQTIHHKKNEIQEVEFFKDKECTEAFDFMDKKDLYIGGLNGDITPLLLTRKCLQEGWYNGEHKNKPNIFIPYLPLYTFEFWYRRISSNIDPIKIHTLSCINSNTGIVTITPNLSKYIPEDNAVLFLSPQDKKQYERFFKREYCGCYTYAKYQNCIARYDSAQQEEEVVIDYDFDKTPITEIQYGNPYPHKTVLNDGQREKFNTITIFLPHGTKSEIQKANEVEKELKEKYGVDEVNLFVLHCFTQQDYILNIYGNCLEDSCLAEDVCNFNKIITTNSTGVLKPEDSTERLQVIDAKEVFEDSLKTQR